MGEIRIKLYAEDFTSNLISNSYNGINAKIENETENYLLNVGENQYVEHLKGEYEIELLTLFTNDIYLETREENIHGTQFTYATPLFDKTKTYKTSVIIYNIPYSGNVYLLRHRPSAFSSMHGIELKVDTDAQTIKLEFINFYNDQQAIKRSYENTMRMLLSNFRMLIVDIERFNSGLEKAIRDSLNRRKQQILENKNFVASLGFPVRKNENVSETFAVPKPKLRKKISIKPTVDERGFAPEPTLDNGDYNDILKIINDVGKNFERLPSVYTKKKEEDLRDHILLTLDPNFEFGSAGGETFNKSGKTDISLRYDSSVVFIAECKFWKGEKEFAKTIDQLLGYLTWRDSKTSIIVFVRNKEITSILQTVKTSIKTHP
jgi:hypothetical protein